MLFSEKKHNTDNQSEIIKKIKNGEKALFVYMADEYRNKIIAAASSLSICESEREDLIQEGYIALYSAICSYDESRGASFSTFANLCIRNRMLNWIEKNMNSSASSYQLSAINETQLTQSGMIEDGFENSVIVKDELHDLLALADKLLSELEKRVFSLYIKGYTNSEICKSLSISRKSCDNTLFRIRTKLRAGKS